MAQIKLEIVNENNNWKINMNIGDAVKSFDILNPDEEILVDFFDEVIEFLMSEDILLRLREGKLSKLKKDLLMVPNVEEYPDSKNYEIEEGITKEFVDNFVKEVYRILDDINSNLNKEFF